MPGTPFIHLRVRSAYSLAEGALPAPRLVELATQHDMPALAVTDTNNLFGALELSEKLAAAGVQPITGITLAVDFADTPQQEAGAPLPPPALALLAMSEEGYANLMRLSSLAWQEGALKTGRAHVPLAAVEELNGGLICLTGGPPGPIDRALAEAQDELAAARLDLLREAFGDRLYVELQRHGEEPEKRNEPWLVERAYALGLPLVATNDCHFATHDDFAAHEVLLCIADGVQLDDPGRRRLTPEHHFKSPNEMKALFADLPEAVANTAQIARRCHFRPQTRRPMLPRYTGDDGAVRDEAAELRAQAHAGLKRRLAVQGPAAGFSERDYVERLDYELGVIEQMGFPGYFLIVADFIQWAKGRGIPVGPGRGSGAGSLVAYALTITDLDPLRFGLLFERFLNPERVSMPDFDIDFCQERRDEVIAYVQDRYGADNVAQIITFGTLQARAVVRDVGRVLGMPYPQVDRLSKLVPSGPGVSITLGEAIEAEPRLKAEAEADEQVARLLAVGQKLEGLFRHASTHAAGVVIGERPLVELIPLYRDPNSALPVTQFNMKWVEQAGLVKFDFLGLKTLSVIDRAVALIRRADPDFVFAVAGLDDAETYAMLARGETVGVFQLESTGMRDAVRQIGPDCIDDIIAVVALYRPGPMDNIPKYCNVKKGHEEPDYPHPDLEPILKETYGIIVYQEQVMEIAKVLSGYSLGEADLLRRAMGKKIRAEMDAQKARFVEGAEQRGIERGQAERIFELVARFADYGFNKSHAACYAVIAYQTAWLKRHHPAEFLAASMTFDMHNTDKLGVFMREAARLDVKVRGPDINRTQAEFVVEDGAIVYSLSALKNVGRAAVEHLVEVREKGGPFASIADFARRIDPHIVNRRALEAMARAGAFDALEPNRARVLAAVDAILQLAQRTREDMAVGQASLFGGDAAAAPEELPLPDVAPWDGVRKLAEEFAAVGFHLSGHPLDDFMAALKRIGVVEYAQVCERLKHEKQLAVRMAAVVTMKRERRSQSGNLYAFVGFSDPSGQFEAVCFSDVLNAHRELLEPESAVLLKVEATAENDEVKLRINGVESLTERARAIAGGLEIHLRETAGLPRIADMLQNGGKSPVRLVLHSPRLGRVDMLLGERFSVSPEIKAALKTLPGVLDVRDL